MRSGPWDYEPARKAVEQARAASLAYAGIVCRTSAALAWGWEVLRIPPQPHITIPKNRRTARLHAADVVLRKANLCESDIDNGITTRGKTLLDCLRFLPLGEGLCVADSALRAGFSPQRMAELAANARGPGAMRIKLNARMATPLAANPFESALRALALGIAGLDVEPQVDVHGAVGFLGRSDLVDAGLRLILEADSAEFHATVSGINRDAERYNIFTINEWTVLRFTWEQVVNRPLWVRAVLIRAVAMRRRELGLPELEQARTYWDATEAWAS